MASNWKLMSIWTEKHTNVAFNSILWKLYDHAPAPASVTPIAPLNTPLTDQAPPLMYFLLVVRSNSIFSYRASQIWLTTHKKKPLVAFLEFKSVTLTAKYSI